MKTKTDRTEGIIGTVTITIKDFNILLSTLLEQLDRKSASV